MDEEDMEQKIDFIAITTLRTLKGVFIDNELDDRQATLSLHYFINVLVKNGWKGEDQVDILKETIKIIESLEKEKMIPRQF